MKFKDSVAEWFSKKKKAKEDVRIGKLEIPDNLWLKCPQCEETLFTKDLDRNLKVCPKCNYHFKLSFQERLLATLDSETFVEFESNIRSTNFLNFVDSKPYHERIKESIHKTGLYEAIITGEGKLNGHPIALGIMNFSFMGGSMGSVVGEKVTQTIERAIHKKLPVLFVSASGGARMQEGIMSLMQMAKTSAALAKLSENNLPYVSLLTDPTTGGVSASYAMLGDLNIAEPNALIGFAGPRVIEQTIRQKLPAGFQRSEYVRDHGMLDIVTERKNIKNIIAKFLEFCGF